MVKVEVILSEIPGANEMLLIPGLGLVTAAGFLSEDSIKFSNPSEETIIEAKRNNNKTFISIIDKGVGIPSDSLPYIFDRFYRVDESRTKSTGGTGLGLSIAKQIIEAHGGEIFAESELGKGTKVTFTIPVE